MFRKKPPVEPAPVQDIALATAPDPEFGIFDRVVSATPSAQNALDLFKDHWTSSLPPVFGLHAGHLPTFEDSRIKTLLAHLDSIKSSKVLELGPFEGGNTYMLHEAGAKLVAIESSAHCLLKCLIVKDILNLIRATFVLGDFNTYLETTNDRFDMVLASGVLYHQADPIHLLESIAKVTDSVAIWTHYWDERVVQASEALSSVLGGPPTVTEWRGRSVRTHPLQSAGSIGQAGPAAERWLERDGLLTVLTMLGFDEITVLDDQPDHDAGPAILLVANR